MKKVSVAMITYNHEKYIEEAITSVMNQKGKFDIELVIGNDCSKDNTSKIINKLVKKYPNKIVFLDREKNMGVINNLLDVLSHCDGDYVAFLEGDDYWLTDSKLKKQIDFLEKNKDYSICGTDCYVIDQNGNYLTDNSPLLMFRDEYKKPKEFFKYNYGQLLSLVYRNDNKEEILNDLKKLLNGANVVADYALKAYFITLGKFKNIDEKLGVYRYVVSNSTSYSSSGYKGLINGYRDVIITLNNLYNMCSNVEVKKDIKIEIRRKKIIYMLIYIKARDFKGLLKYIKNLKNDIGLFKVTLYMLLMPFEAIRYLYLNITLRRKARRRNQNG